MMKIKPCEAQGRAIKFRLSGNGEVALANMQMDEHRIQWVEPINADSSSDQLGARSAHKPVGIIPAVAVNATSSDLERRIFSLENSNNNV